MISSNLSVAVVKMAASEATASQDQSAALPAGVRLPLQELAAMACLSLNSIATRRNYSRELLRFLSSGRPLTREGVQSHVNAIRATGVGPVSVNVALAAIKLLAREAEARGLIAWADAAAIASVKSQPIRGTKAGNWLTLGEARAYLDAVSALSKRNGALVAVLLGCGLRRSEVASVEWPQFAQREGRWCFVDLVGKGKRIRTVPCPDWAAEYVQRWRKEGEDGRIFKVTASRVYQIVTEASEALALDVTPHDLRRTWAKLSRKGGASIEQIQECLGHASIKTTQMYLGTHLELERGKAAPDYIDMKPLI